MGMRPGGAGAGDASEIAWIYGPAAQACYWLSEKGPPHDEGPFYRQAANLNVFARIEHENGFYKESARLQRYGQQRILVTKIQTLSPSTTTSTHTACTAPHDAAAAAAAAADSGDKGGADGWSSADAKLAASVLASSAFGATRYDWAA